MRAIENGELIVGISAEKLSRIKQMLVQGLGDSIALYCLRTSKEVDDEPTTEIDSVRIDYQRAINYITEIEEKV